MNADAPQTDKDVEQVIGRLLQAGVLVSATVVLVGTILILLQNSRAPVDYRVFRAEPDTLRTLVGVVRAARAADSRAIVQLGLVLLIATPVARVAFTLVAFARQRDRAYVMITTIVLALLLYSLFFAPG